MNTFSQGLLVISCICRKSSISLCSRIQLYYRRHSIEVELPSLHRLWQCLSVKLNFWLLKFVSRAIWLNSEQCPGIWCLALTRTPSFASVYSSSVHPAPPPPWTLVGHFSPLSVPGIGHYSTLGHLTASWFSPNSAASHFVLSNDKFVGKGNKFEINYIWGVHNDMLDPRNER